MKNDISMGARLIDDFTRKISSVPFCQYHFVHTILSNTILSVYHFVHTILSVPFCPRTPFFSHRPYFFRFSLSLLCVEKHIYCRHGSFFTRKTSIYEKILGDTFFSQFVLSHASNITSQNIGGTDA